MQVLARHLLERITLWSKKIVTGYLKLVEAVCITLLFLIFVLMVVRLPAAFYPSPKFYRRNELHFV